MRYQADELTIESVERDNQLVLRWLGRSEAKEPSLTLQPLMEEVIGALEGTRSVEFDFRALEYMNSSTIRPILKLLQTASTRSGDVHVRYDAGKTWQRMSFLAIGVALASLSNVKVTA
jgi:anti-anti-sigma regulatory factor